MTFAQFVGSGSSGVIGFINLVIVPIIFAITFFVFVFGVLKYFIFHGDNDTERQHGRQFVLWGVLGMILMFSIWGVLNLLLSTLGIAR